MKTMLFLMSFIMSFSLTWAGEQVSDLGTDYSLSSETVSAKEQQEIFLTVRSPGRYGIWTESSQGTGIQLVDRMGGPGKVEGIPGEEDGRIDSFLEVGEYKLITHGHRFSKGEVALHVRRFTAIEPDSPRGLVEYKLIETTLEDYQIRTYWLDIKQVRWVSIEAAGRNLSDMRFWLNGSWLIDAVPDHKIITPVSGKPLRYYTIHAKLNPGIYSLSLYGGLTEPWAEEDGSRPLSLRFGIPILGEAGSLHMTAGSFGMDRWLIPNSANYFRISIPEAEAASISVDSYDPETTFPAGGTTGIITKKSRIPATEVSFMQSSHTHSCVTIRRAPGKTYHFQYFKQTKKERFEGDRNYRLLTLHSGNPLDTIDATSILTRSDSSRESHEEVIAARVLELGDNHYWQRRFNLIEMTTIYLHLEKPQKYRFFCRESQARYRIEPFMVRYPREYRPPEFRSFGTIWDLDAGYHILTINPVRKGIVEIAVVPEPAVGFSFDSSSTDLQLLPRQGACLYSDIPLESKQRYTLYISHQPGIKTGLNFRKLRMNPIDPVPVVQHPGESVKLPIEIDDTGELYALDHTGNLVEFVLDSRTCSRERIGPGKYDILIPGDIESLRSCSLIFESDLHRSGTELPLFEAPYTTDYLDFDFVSTEKPGFFDLDRRASRTFNVKTEEPGLYRLYSTGLLSVEGVVRTRLITHLSKKSANGTGRNFLIQKYLNPGEYQVTVTSQGQSRGHLGLAIEKASILDGGSLRDRIPARITLDPGTGVVYSFNLSEPGTYRIDSRGLKGPARCRLEDGEGWPVTSPGRSADFTIYMKEGSYRLILEPEAIRITRKTILSQLIDKTTFPKGKLYDLVPGTTGKALWQEPPEGQFREPDIWKFTLHAEADLTFQLTGEMKGLIKRKNLTTGIWEEKEEILPRRNLTVRLEAGIYHLETECSRKNDKVEYELRADPVPLLAGGEKTVTAPLILPVSVGRYPGTGDSLLVELKSEGTADVRGILTDKEGRFIAASENRPDDWNFYISSELESGEYLLRVEPSEGFSASCTVTMEIPEIRNERISIPFEKEIVPGDSILKLRSEIPPHTGFLWVELNSRENITAAVRIPGKTKEAAEYRSGKKVSFELPVSGGESVDLILRSMDHRGIPCTCRITTVPSIKLSESTVNSSFSLAGQSRGGPILAEIDLKGPGLFQVPDGLENLYYSDEIGQVCRPVRNGILADKSATQSLGDPAARIAQTLGGSSS